MEIKGLDYNTQREKLAMTEYGRSIQKMVDHAMTLPTREERLRCAKTIVRLMESKNPQVREKSDYQQTLWDHLYIMSRKQLDIDWPYDVSRAESIQQKPQSMKYATAEAPVQMRHYGRLIAQMLEKLKEMPEGTERNRLASMAANQMKRDLATWGHGNVEEDRVLEDLARFTDGKVRLDPATFRFERLTADALPQTEGGKRKKKRK